MLNSRLDTLRQMVEQEPTSSFARYGLAMELVKGGDLEAAVAQFNELIATNPDYPAAYFHAGQTLEKMGRTTRPVPSTPRASKSRHGSETDIPGVNSRPHWIFSAKKVR